MAMHMVDHCNKNTLVDFLLLYVADIIVQMADHISG